MRLTVVLGLNVVLIAALVVVGIAAHSVAVLAEGADYLADGAAIGVSLLAIHLSRRPPTTQHSLGYPKATNIAALVNGGWLLVLNVLVIVAATLRVLSGSPHVSGLPVLVVSGIAAGLMLVGSLILREGDDVERDLNMKAVLLDTAADAAAAAGVAIAGAVIYATGRWYWLDPAVALLIAIVVAYHTVVLLRDVAVALRAKPQSAI